MGIIAAHNHPSGDPSPSEQDIATTQQLIAVGHILGGQLLDHVIVAGREPYSFRGSRMVVATELDVSAKRFDTSL